MSENWLGIKQTISFDEFILIIWWQIFVLANAIRLATNRLKRSDNCYNNFCIKYICVVLFIPIITNNDIDMKSIM